MSKASVSALSRSYRGERSFVTLVGLLALAGGGFVVVVGQGWLGDLRAGRPLADPIVLDFLRANADVARAVAIAAGVLLLIVGLVFFLRALRPERHPDLVLDDTTEHRLTVTSSALTEAINADCATIDGVSRARSRLVGSTAQPALRLHVSLEEGADVREVWQTIESGVLDRAREALGMSTLPIAVRLELDASSAQRVH